MLVVSVHPRPTDVLNAHLGRTGGLEVQHVRHAAGKVDHPVAVERTAIVDTHDHRTAVLQVRDARIGRKRHRRVGRGQGVLVENLAVRRHPAMEGRAVPGGETHLVVVAIKFRAVPLAGDLVGLSDKISAAAFRNRLAFGDNARTSLHAVFLRVELVFCGRGRGAGSQGKAGREYRCAVQDFAEARRTRIRAAVRSPVQGVVRIRHAVILDTHCRLGDVAEKTGISRSTRERKVCRTRVAQARFRSRPHKLQCALSRRCLNRRLSPDRMRLFRLSPISRSPYGPSADLNTTLKSKKTTKAIARFVWRREDRTKAKK